MNNLLGSLCLIVLLSSCSSNNEEVEDLATNAIAIANECSEKIDSLESKVDSLESKIDDLESEISSVKIHVDY